MYARVDTIKQQPKYAIVGLSLLSIDILYNLSIDMDSMIDNWVVDAFLCWHLIQQSTNAIVGLSVLYIDNM